METAEKTHWRKMVNMAYLGSYSLQQGKDLILTIKHVAREEVKGEGGKKDMCIVAYFTDAPENKPMILNRTNCKTISKIYNSSFIEDWAGKKIQIFSANISVAGEPMEALRIRPIIPAGTVPPVDVVSALTILNLASTLSELQEKYTGLTTAEKAHPEVIALKEKLKTELK